MEKTLFIHESVINSILGYAKACHPREGILLLRGKTEKDKVVITEVEIPPLATHGQSFSDFPLYMLPIDFSIIGTAHSHPSGVLRPSVGDFNNFYGRIMIITSFPYEAERDLLALNREGERVSYEVSIDSK